MTPYAASNMRAIQDFLRSSLRSADRVLVGEIAAAVGLKSRDAGHWLKHGDGKYWQSERVRECLPGTKAPRWRRYYWWDGQEGVDGQD